MMKKTLIFLTVLTILLIALTSCKKGFEVEITEDNVKDIPSTLSVFDQIDKKYNTEWKQESIPNKLIGLSVVDKAVADIGKIKELQAKMNLTQKVSISPLKDVLYNLTTAREKMLESEKYYLEMENLGDAGKIKFYYNEHAQPVINQTINCSQVPTLLKGAELIDKSFIAGTEAKMALDHVLQESSEARDIIGINNKKPKFYSIKFAEVKRQAEINRQMSAICLEKAKAFKASSEKAQ